MIRWLVALSVLAAPAVRAETLEERFAAANSLYQKKRFNEARAAYEVLIERFGVRAAAVQYNLGNAEFELEHIGRAILAYKRALTLSPSPDLERGIRANLESATAAIVERHRKDQDRAVTVLDETHGALYSVFHLVSPALSGWAMAGLWVGLLGLIALRRRLAFARTAAVITAIPWALATTLFLGNVITSEAVVRGVVVKDNVRLQEGRGAGATESDVPEGLEVRILDTSDPAETQIRLSNGREGWVPAKAVGAI